MRYIIAASLLATGALSQSTADYLKCVSSALGSIDTSTFTNCTDKSPQDCLCANKSALESLSTSAAADCTGIDLSALTDSLCPEASTESPAPARHASLPMEPAQKRAFAPEPEAASPAAEVPRVVYVTETRTDCSCKSTPVAERPMHPMHVSQIPVQVPSSSMGVNMGAVAMSTPAASYSHGVLVAASSSVVYGSMATPAPSGVDPSRFSPFMGGAESGRSVGKGLIAGVALVMGVMAAL
ncbi:uncharacterized protein N7515_004847 [Penicillium bovifimosum]|uniref:Extracellular membrane protein CFEM domain-containing protein n=1 Tax=Penicillium bovifimosum TaxID=126998 RepID=A0A9W9L4C5_9EURO|nr:uncharacterized protein N7515_004847 [Penicillium bovifimosum]KAJ5135569.1 hypothetical protein N7515_004847 [Penicillium bovifimosum]